MTPIAVLLLVLMAASAVTAEPAPPAGALCADLLEARRRAESEGRLDFSVVVEVTTDQPAEMTPHVRIGSSYSVGRIHFTGHSSINDSTLRRAMTLQEREPFDVGQLRRSLARLNEMGLAEPLTLADVVVAKRADGATADLTIPLRERRRRWWSLSGPIIPGLGSYEASISSRLPPWGRGVVDASTYLITFNLLGLAKPLLGVLPFVSKAPPAVLAIERPLLPGQEWLSGFALSPWLSPRATVAHYGRTQIGRRLHAMVEGDTTEALAVPVVGNGRQTGEVLVCEPPAPRWMWLRRGALSVIDLTLAAVLP